MTIKIKTLSEKGQSGFLLAITFFLFCWIMVAIMASTSNCAVTLWETVRFWNNYCS